MSYPYSLEEWADSIPWIEEEQHKRRSMVAPTSTDPGKTAEDIHRILESVDSDEECTQKMVNLLSAHNAIQRQEVQQKYAQKFGGINFVEQLKKRLPANELITAELLQALMDTPPEHDAKYLHKAMKGLGTNEDMLIEILVTRSNKQLRAIKDAYKALFNRDLTKTVISETSGTLKALLVDLLEADRDESWRSDPEKAKTDAKALYDAGEGRLGTNEAVFVEIMANQNLKQLRLLFDEYEILTKHPIEKAIKAEFSGDSKAALLALVEFVRTGPVGQVVKLMQKCIEGKANEELLVHLVYTYKELNMLDIIADEYNRNFKGPLAKAIQHSAKSAILKNALVYMIKKSMN